MGNDEADRLMSPSRTETDGGMVLAEPDWEETMKVLSLVSGGGQVFFGEDIRGCNSNGFPNAISARDDFYSYLDPEILTETFEGITGGAPKSFNL